MRRQIVILLGAALGAAPAALRAQAPEGVPLSLAQAVAVARDTTPGVRLAALRVEESEARARQARGALLPTVGATVGNLDRTFNRASMGIEFPAIPGQAPIPDLIGPFDNFDARLKLTQTLFDPAGFVRTRAAREAVAGSTAERDVAAEAAAQRAAATYLRAGRAGAVVSARREDVRLAEELVALAREQLAAGVSTAIDVTRAESQRVAAVGMMRVAENGAAQAQIELARALGVDPGTRFALSDTLPGDAGAAAADAGEATRRALAARPDLRSAAALETVAKTQRRSIRAERLPRLDLVADWGVNGPSVEDAISTRQVGVQVSLPLVDGLRRESRLAEQDAVVREAQLRHVDLRRQIEAEVRSALLDAESGREQQEVAAERLRLAEEELGQARERFANGVAGNIELISAQSSLVRARDAVIDARYATAQARVSLARAVGAAGALR
ncbi:MAG: TolC family protein [Longimicrobiaceae bacterium]